MTQNASCWAASRWVAGWPSGQRWPALTGAVKAQGLVLVRPWVSDVDQIVSLIQKDKAHRLHSTIIVGENDEPCFEVSLTLAEQLKRHGMRCELEVYPDLAHEYPPDFEVVLARALEHILQD